MAVANGWLEVTVKANADTGLAQPDRFAFGNLMGDTGDGRVNALDLATVKRLFSANVALFSIADFNHDGRINALDLAVVKQNLVGSWCSPSLRIPLPHWQPPGGPLPIGCQPDSYRGESVIPAARMACV